MPSFDTVPAEIRLQIYEYYCADLLSRAGHPNSLHTHHGKKWRIWVDVDAGGQFQMRKLRSVDQLSLLCVNKKTSLEFEEFIYSRIYLIISAEATFKRSCEQWQGSQIAPELLSKFPGIGRWCRYVFIYISGETKEKQVRTAMLAYLNWHYQELSTNPSPGQDTTKPLHEQFAGLLEYVKWDDTALRIDSVKEALPKAFSVWHLLPIFGSTLEQFANLKGVHMHVLADNIRMRQLVDLLPLARLPDFNLSFQLGNYYNPEVRSDYERFWNITRRHYLVNQPIADDSLLAHKREIHNILKRDSERHDSESPKYAIMNCMFEHLREGCPSPLPQWTKYEMRIFEELLCYRKQCSILESGRTPSNCTEPGHNHDVTVAFECRNKFADLLTATIRLPRLEEKLPGLVLSEEQEADMKKTGISKGKQEKQEAIPVEELGASMKKMGVSKGKQEKQEAIPIEELGANMKKMGISEGKQEKQATTKKRGAFSSLLRRLPWRKR